MKTLVGLGPESDPRIARARKLMLACEVRAVYSTVQETVSVGPAFDDGDLRRDLHVPNEGSPRLETVHAADADDTSEQHAIVGRYDMRCPYCQLGYPHTEAKHRKEMGQ